MRSGHVEGGEATSGEAMSHAVTRRADLSGGRGMVPRRHDKVGERKHGACYHFLAIPKLNRHFHPCRSRAGILSKQSVEREGEDESVEPGKIEDGERRRRVGEVVEWSLCVVPVQLLRVPTSSIRKPHAGAAHRPLSEGWARSRPV